MCVVNIIALNYNRIDKPEVREGDSEFAILSIRVNYIG